MNDIDNVLKILTEWSYIDDGIWYGYNTLADETCIHSLKKLMNKLKDEKIIDYSCLVNDEGMLQGKGYLLKEKYIDKTYEQIEKELKNE